MQLIKQINIGTNSNTQKTIGADRVKVAVPVSEVKERLENTINNLNSKFYKANPTTKPIFHYNYKEKVVFIDVCVSKMLFHNNLEEAIEADFNLFVDKIKHYAYENGLIISEESIKNASVWYLEYGKNILLDKKYSINAILSRLGKALDKKGQTYEASKYYSNIGNNGFSVALHTQNKKSIFYDKTTKEIYASKNQENKNIYKQILDKNLQVLRVELKFLKKASVKENICKRLKKTDITLIDIWNSNLAQSIIKDFWQETLYNMPQKIIKQDQLIKYFNRAVEEGLSIQETLLLYAYNDLVNKLGYSLSKRMFIPIKTKLSSKARQQQYSALRKKYRKNKHLFSIKKDYANNKITEYIENFIAIRLTRSEDFGYEEQIVDIKGEF